MQRVTKPTETPIPAPIMAAHWETLTGEERDEATTIARREGRRAARWYLAEPPSRSPNGHSLRRTRWAREHDGFDRVTDHVLHRYAAAQTVACEHHYIEHVIEPHFPEKAVDWWGLEREERRADPRVCCFCDGYERERCRLLGMPEPPTAIADLQSYLWAAKEQEREQGRLCLASVEASADASGASEWSVERWDYQRYMLCSDLAEMLLRAARYSRPSNDGEITPRF